MKRIITLSMLPLVCAVFLFIFSGAEVMYAQTETSEQTRVIITPSEEDIATYGRSLDVTQVNTVTIDYVDTCFSPCSFIATASQVVDWIFYVNGQARAMDDRKTVTVTLYSAVGLYNLKYIATFPNGDKSEMPFQIRIIEHPTPELEEKTCLVSTQCDVLLRFTHPWPEKAEFIYNISGLRFVAAEFSQDRKSLKLIFYSGEAVQKYEVGVGLIANPYTKAAFMLRFNIVNMVMSVKMPLILQTDVAN